MEHLGSGMSRILNAYDESIFELTPNFLVITFSFGEGFLEASVSGDDADDIVNDADNNVNDADNNVNDVDDTDNDVDDANGADPKTGYVILELIRSNPDITTGGLVAGTGKSRSTIFREVKK